MRKLTDSNYSTSDSRNSPDPKTSVPTVRVEGPAILKDAFASLLAESELGSGHDEPSVLLLVGDDWQGRLRALPERLRLLPKVLVASRVTDLQIAHDHDIHAYLHEDEPVGELLRALRAAGRRKAYHSPRLLQSVLRTVQQAPLPPTTLQLDDGILRLSEREREIAIQAAAGLSNGEIGERLSISGATVRFHLHNVFQKLGIQRRGQLVSYVIPRGSSERIRQKHS